MSLLLIVVSSHFIVNNILEVCFVLAVTAPHIFIRNVGHHLVLGTCELGRDERYRCICVG